MERRQLTADMDICPVLNGMWQVSGAHGRINLQEAVRQMFAYVDAGFDTWDLADHYGPAEDLMGEFRQMWCQMRDGASLSRVRAFTKWVPRPVRITKPMVHSAVQTSRQRMRMDSLDLLQFHWWDYSNPSYLDALRYLTELQSEGKIRHLALTNFDTEHLGIILQEGIPVVSNQVQFSVVDRRPQVAMIPFCQQNNIQLLAYGTLCGGLLSEKYLGQPEPRGSLDTASLRKYKNMIDAWGGWTLFQELLGVLKQIADKHSADNNTQFKIPHVAMRYVLDQPQVAGVIIGARLSISQHIQENLQVFDLRLDESDRQQIESFSQRSRNLFQAIGDCGDEYRR